MNERGPLDDGPRYEAGVSLPWLIQKVENAARWARLKLAERAIRKKINKDWKVEGSSTAIFAMWLFVWAALLTVAIGGELSDVRRYLRDHWTGKGSP